jgi:hypothetical protein
MMWMQKAALHSFPQSPKSEHQFMPDEPRTISIPLRRMTQAELDSFLETAADILRGNVISCATSSLWIMNRVNVSRKWPAGSSSAQPMSW